MPLESLFLSLSAFDDATNCFFLARVFPFSVELNKWRKKKALWRCMQCKLDRIKAILILMFLRDLWLLRKIKMGIKLRSWIRQNIYRVSVAGNICMAANRRYIKTLPILSWKSFFIIFGWISSPKCRETWTSWLFILHAFPACKNCNEYFVISYCLTIIALVPSRMKPLISNLIGLNAFLPLLFWAIESAEATATGDDSSEMKNIKARWPNCVLKESKYSFWK